MNDDRRGCDLADSVRLMMGDCIERMGEIESGSVDLIAADLPYQVTACGWDTIIPFRPLWASFDRVLSDAGSAVFTASQPFTSSLILSNTKLFKYTLVWDKALHSNPLNAPYQPLRLHEDVVVFSRMACTYSPRGTMTFNPQLEPGEPYVKSKKTGPVKQIFRTAIMPSRGVNESGDRRPTSIIRISNANQAAKVHPTQKPVALFEYLIRTYSNEGETVLDCTMGSGTTGIACLNTNRRFIGIERDPTYFDIASRRIADAQSSTPLLSAPCPP